MVPSFKTILCAVDLSEKSEPIFAHAVSLAERFDAKLYVAHVIEPISASLHSQVAGIMGEVEWEKLQLDKSSKVIDNITQRVRQLCESLGSNAKACVSPEDQLIIRRGVSHEELIKLIGELKADLIVVGTHRYGAVQDSLMGGTVRRLIRQSKTPVFVVQ